MTVLSRTKVFSALAASADGYITGPDPSPEQALGAGGGQLFDWYFSGDQPSRQFDGFRLAEPSREVFDTVAARVGAIIAGRTTYDHSGGWDGRGPHPTAPLFVLSHRPPPERLADAPQVFVSTGIEDAIARASRAAAETERDVALMGSGVINAALRAGLLDEVTVHQVPVLLGGGTPYFGALPAPVDMDVVRVVAAPGVTHLTFAIRR
ncbi:MAG TPA: dihydrofolate reductase family protein [Streptosporangiaceae bacterium]|jgi:dihydrofolate reductase|nr:dihydrofolate reductase family protein [Streptosporangiaceae bacterium]